MTDEQIQDKFINDVLPQMEGIVTTEQDVRIACRAFFYGVKYGQENPLIIDQIADAVALRLRTKDVKEWFGDFNKNNYICIYENWKIHLQTY